MVQAGLFEDERVELLDGFLVTMTPIGPPHSGARRRSGVLDRGSRRPSRRNLQCTDGRSLSAHGPQIRQRHHCPIAFPDVQVDIGALLAD
jgi:hypothetical protein